MIKKNTKPTIGIVGLGYVGLLLARFITKSNFNIIGFDIDKIKIKKNISYIKSPSKNDLLNLNTKGNFFLDFINIKNYDIITICVPKEKNNLTY
jgi:UDP-N-acetyl-D-glucosamine dehydrogenase